MTFFRFSARPVALPLAALLLAPPLLAGCASGRPRGPLVASHVAPAGATIVDLLVATTRSADRAEPGEIFSGERGRGVRYADISISIPPGHKSGEVEWPTQDERDPQRVFATMEAKILDKDQAIAAFDARIRKTPKRQVLIFVHGYNTRFEEAVYRFAQIVNDSAADVTPVLFTWPSRGKLLDYGYDHESASYSRDALEGMLQTLARDKNVGEISILAHSMGNWVTLEALRQMAIRNHGVPDKLRNVMLAAPDVDFDVFRRQIAEIDARRPLFTLFASRDDNALAVSKRIWGDKPRVGAVDANASPYREVFTNDRVNVVDLTQLPREHFLGHSKYATGDVVRAIGARLAQGQQLNDAHIGVGDRLGMATAGAASTVGAAAGVAVAAPFAIVDPHTRENLSEHINAVGDNAGHALESALGAARP
ncbi:MAG: alpha/beta hydrolase [Methylocystis sp.]|nr:alpha/beta hydrolase [Methylocystis sp.]